MMGGRGRAGSLSGSNRAQEWAAGRKRAGLPRHGRRNTGPEGRVGARRQRGERAAMARPAQLPTRPSESPIRVTPVAAGTARRPQVPRPLEALPSTMALARQLRRCCGAGRRRRRRRRCTVHACTVRAAVVRWPPPPPMGGPGSAGTLTRARRRSRTIRALLRADTGRLGAARAAYSTGANRRGLPETDSSPSGPPSGPRRREAEPAAAAKLLLRMPL